jgi:citrate lyase beta subunit
LVVATAIIIAMAATAKSKTEQAAYEIVSRSVSSAQAAPFVPIEKVATEAVLVKKALAAEKAPAKKIMPKQQQSDLMTHWAAVMDQLGTVHKTKLLTMIQCESGGVESVDIIDSNGKRSRGILQFQDTTWSWFSKEAGVSGSPLRGTDAIRVADWALGQGLGRHWSCY